MGYYVDPNPFAVDAAADAELVAAARFAGLADVFALARDSEAFDVCSELCGEAYLAYASLCVHLCDYYDKTSVGHFRSLPLS